MSKVYRVKEVAAVRDQSGGYVTPIKGDKYEGDDFLVRTYPWMFEAEGTASAEPEPVVESVPIPPAPEPPVERATRAPGERRPATKAAPRGRKTAAPRAQEGWGA